MQFHLTLQNPAAPSDVEAALATLDPSALVDLQEGTGVLRISTLLDEMNIVHAVRSLGIAVSEQDVVRQPSECCGGCGG